MNVYSFIEPRDGHIMNTLLWRLNHMSSFELKVQTLVEVDDPSDADGFCCSEEPLETDGDWEVEGAHIGNKKVLNAEQQRI